MRDDEGEFTREAEAAGRIEEEAPAAKRASVRKTAREPLRGASSEAARETGMPAAQEPTSRTTPADLADLEVPRDDASESEIRERAYELYRMRGGLDGFDQADWYAAEQEVRARRERPGGGSGSER